MRRILTRQQLHDRLDAIVRTSKSQAAAAILLGVSDAYLSDVLNGRREPGEKMLEALGVERDVRYVVVKAPQ